MFIAKVIGNVVSTQKIAKFTGMKLLLIQPYISRAGKLQESGSSVVAVDSVGAGEVLSVHVIARPHSNLGAVLPK